MRTRKLLPLLLVCVMLLSVLASCTSSDEPADTTADSVTEAPTEDKETESKAPDNGENDPDAEPVQIKVADAKFSNAKMTGVPKSVFEKEGGKENVIEGAEQSPSPHAVIAALPSPTVITSVVIQAPTVEQNTMAKATVEASTDGVNWETLKTLGSSIVAGKTYTLNISKDTAFLFVRIRQNTDAVTQRFVMRTMLINGIPQAGSAGDLSNVPEEKVNLGPTVVMREVFTSSKASASGDPAKVFTDEAGSWISEAGADSANYIAATMTKKTVIKQIIVKVAQNNASMIGATVQASENGGTWVNLFTVTEVSTNGEYEYFVTDEKAYSYIRVIQDASKAAEAFQVDTVLILGDETETATADFPTYLLNWSSVDITFKGYTGGLMSGSQAPRSVFIDGNKNIWNSAVGGTDGVASVTGQFYSPTVIKVVKVVGRLQETFDGMHRLNGAKVQASVDGETWVTLYTISGYATEGNTDPYLFIKVDDSTAYNYIRLYKEGINADDPNNKALSLVGVLVMGDAELEAPDPLDVTFIGYEGGVMVNNPEPTHIFEETNTSTWNSAAGGVNGVAWASGELSKASVITNITVIGRIDANFDGMHRLNNVQIQASVDGVTWVTIATLSGFATEGNTDPKVELTVTDTTAYKYVRIYKEGLDANDSTNKALSIGTVLFYSMESDED